jgi:lysophospholipase L1-like esterase
VPNSLGVGGTCSTQTAELVVRAPPPASAVYVVMTGLNDARRHGPSTRALNSYTAALHTIFRALAAAEPGALITCLEQPHLVDYSQHAPHDHGSDAEVDAYNQRMREVAGEHPRVLIAVATAWDPSTMLAADTVHPNDAGHQELARAVVRGAGKVGR